MEVREKTRVFYDPQGLGPIPTPAPSPPALPLPAQAGLLLFLQLVKRLLPQGLCTCGFFCLESFPLCVCLASSLHSYRSLLQGTLLSEASLSTGLQVQLLPSCRFFVFISPITI